ncbi:glycosyltransferase [Mangrovibacterium diazotrophicum]|uniref:GT2 family glycosyltransferase n=1 Tax=Mangrovibacterium diazotrophicum TaxID=1261403 RepID=A0A419W5N5_9BACT|nr:glycosyltransferase [Mangrovibacterium diazotrophicum]RKD90773.1 GT2 family glycosyltransferase [Mangrovibacterium diazotrophicum]
MLGIVLINYKNEEEIIHYIQHELSGIELPHNIVIVDNSCDESSISKLESELTIREISNGIDKSSNLFLIDAKGNLGYARANNLGAQFLKDNFECKYILFSNSDIHFDKKDVLSPLIEKLGLNDRISAINPMIIDENFNYQSPMIEISIWKLYISRFLFYPITRKISPIVNNAPEGEYGRLMGCFLLVRACDFFEVDMFDNNTFLYGEELILSEKFRKIGKVSYYLPTCKIYHQQSSTIKNFLSEKKQIAMMAKSEFYFYKKYKNVNQLTVLLASFSMIVYLYFYLPLKLFLRYLKNEF